VLGCHSGGGVQLTLRSTSNSAKVRATASSAIGSGSVPIKQLPSRLSRAHRRLIGLVGGWPSRGFEARIGVLCVSPEWVAGGVPG
jgi:hypothetical protein